MKSQQEVILLLTFQLRLGIMLLLSDLEGNSMSIKAVLFDLDGTLLSMDQDNFIKTYMGALTKYHAPLGYDPRPFHEGLVEGNGCNGCKRRKRSE